VRDPSNLVAAIRHLALTCLDWPPSVVDSLAGTGVTTVGECLRLPRAGFARRFGAARLLELDRATGRLPDPRNSWRAPERFLADHDLTEEQSDRGRLLAVCHELLARHERFLRRRQLGTQRLNFSFYHLKTPATTLSIGRVSADHCAARWSHLLDLRFERLRLPEPVIAIRLEGGRNEPLESGAERLAFDNHRTGAERYSMTQLAERFAARIGEASVNGVATVAEHRPHRAWRIRSVAGDGTADGAGEQARSLRRPLWLLPEPRRLPSEDGRPLHGGRLTLLEGPERLETGWWDDHGITRDYYVAINPHGMRLWVYQCRSVQGDWYLHGLFG
jgi:protein ImuB